MSENNPLLPAIVDPAPAGARPPAHVKWYAQTMQIAINGLRAQGWRRSVRAEKPMHCMYRGSDDCACAAGQLMSDANYDVAYEKRVANDLPAAAFDLLPPLPTGMQVAMALAFLRELQQAHDLEELFRARNCLPAEGNYIVPKNLVYPQPADVYAAMVALARKYGILPVVGAPTLVTRQALRDWGACYYNAEGGEAHVNALVPEKGMGLLAVLDLDIPAADRVWVACHAMSQTQRVVFANGCAERAQQYAAARAAYAAAADAVYAARAYAAYAARAARAYAARADAAAERTAAARAAAAASAAADAVYAAASAASAAERTAAARAAASAADAAGAARARRARAYAAYAAERTAQIEQLRSILRATEVDA